MATKNPDQEKPPEYSFINGLIGKARAVVKGHLESTQKIREVKEGRGKTTYIDTHEQIGRPGRGSLPAQPGSVDLLVQEARDVQELVVGPVFEHTVSIGRGKDSDRGLNIRRIIASFMGVATEDATAIPLQDGRRQIVERKTTIDARRLVIEVDDVRGGGGISMSGIGGWTIQGAIGHKEVKKPDSE